MSIYLSENWLSFLSETFGWKIHYLKLKQQDIPFVIKRRIDFQKIASSLPFVHQMPDIGKLSREEFETELLRHQISDFNYHGNIQSPFFSNYSIYSVIKLGLETSSSCDELFATFSKDSIQRKVTKAQKSGFTVSHLKEEKYFKQFQEIQSLTRQRQGSPTYPSNFFLLLKKHLGDRVNLFGIIHGSSLISGIVTFNFNGYAIYAYGASVPSEEYFKQGVNQLCMWESIKFAKTSGDKMYDFGSTPLHHQSLMEYKLKWGGKKEELVYSFYSKTGKKVPVINRESLMARMMEKAIHQMPFSVFKQITPQILIHAVY
jgi:lipid II:glycine glycyltransferase (peptidoglycan interpeptide bridge formation enzyme)